MRFLLLLLLLQVQSVWGEQVRSGELSSKEPLSAKQTDDLEKVGPVLAVSERGPVANGECHWDREDPDITFFNLEFLLV